MTKRDDFTESTKRTLALRVGYCCSNPDCQVVTIGPKQGGDGFINLGIGAHITAAAPLGPRYNLSLSPEQRRDGQNGIWLCMPCSKVIDADYKAYSEERLHKWKADAESRALEALLHRRGPQRADRPAGYEVDENDASFIGALGLSPDETADQIAVRLFQATQADLSKFREMKDWPKPAVTLDLKYRAQSGGQAIDLQGLANGLGAAHVVCLVSEPGTGKSTTMVKLAEAIIEDGRAVPILISLGEWSVRDDTFFEAVIRHKTTFMQFKPAHLMRLAYDGRLVFVLDGWNELDGAAMRRAIRDLETLSREYPMLSWVISGRQQDMPIDGITVSISPLSEDQQLQIAQGMRGAEGHKLVDRALRTRGVRGLIATPLYLRALLTVASVQAFPETKEAILRLFVEHMEQDAAREQVLRASMHGHHGAILKALADSAMVKGRGTFIKMDDARRAVTQIGSALIADGQLGVPFEPTVVIDTLVKHHILVAATGDEPGVSFQHHQFLEWYASFTIESLIRSAATGEAASRDRLRTEVFNQMRWEESILFATERLARSGSGGQESLAAAIVDMLSIDPMLAAEMIYRSTGLVWAKMRHAVVDFVAKWHVPGTVDRAVRFMVIAGRDDFADLVWQFITSGSNDDVFRCAPRFHVSVLGAHAEPKLAQLSDDLRGRVLSEIVFNSTYDGIELAARLAQNDPSPAVVSAVVEALDFRRADRQVSDVMATAHDGVWAHIVKRGYPSALLDPELNDRLVKMVAEARSSAGPGATLSHLLDTRQDDELVKAEIAACIASPDFNVENDGAHNIIYMAHQRFPVVVAQALVNRMAAGLEVGFHARDYLPDAPMVDDGPIAERIATGAKKRHASGYECYVIGPKTAGKMMDRYLDAALKIYDPGQPSRQSVQDEYFAIWDELKAVRDDAFYPAFMARADTKDVNRIEALAELLVVREHRSGKGAAKAATYKAALAKQVQEWIATVLEAGASRRVMSHVTMAAGYVGDTSLLPGIEEMLQRDLDGHEAARTAWLTKPKMPVPGEVMTSYEYQYRDAYMAIGGPETERLLSARLLDTRFGAAAALAMRLIWQRAQKPDEEQKYARYYDYSGVAARRQERAAPGGPPTSRLGTTIIDAAMAVVRQNPDDLDKLRHAVALAMQGYLLPHGDRRQDLERLLSLPLSYELKLPLMRSAAMAGEILPSTMLLAGVAELVADTQHKWKLQPDQHWVPDWCELFAFSDNPAALLDALAQLPEAFSSAWKMDRVCYALSMNPDPTAYDFMLGLVDWKPKIAENHEWITGILAPKSVRSLKAVLGLVEQGKIPAQYHGYDAHALGRRFGAMAQSDTALVDAMLDLYPQTWTTTGREFLETALSELETGDTRIVLAMIRCMTAQNRKYSFTLEKVVAHAVVAHRPVPGWTNGFERFSVAVPELRKQLYGFVRLNEPEAALAIHCLVEIEEARDQYGRVDGEPRHPDIEAGGPWPLLEVPAKALV